MTYYPDEKADPEEELDEHLKAELQWEAEIRAEENALRAESSDPASGMIQAVSMLDVKLQASLAREAALQQRLNEADQRIGELEAMRKDAERYRFLRDGYRAGLECWDDQIAVCDSEDTVFGEALDLMTDGSMERMAERVSLQLTKDSPEVES